MTIGANLPELPDAKKSRLSMNFSPQRYDASVLTSQIWTSAATSRATDRAELQDDGNWVINELFRPPKKDEKAITTAPSALPRLGGVIGNLIASDGAFPGKIAKDLLKFVYTGRRWTLPLIAKNAELKQVTDTSAIEGRGVDEIIAANPYQGLPKRGENPKLAGWFVVAKTMKATGGPRRIPKR